jgi:hypothetical protein
MRDEHDDHARHLRDPGRLANDHTPPEHASPEWRVLYAGTRKPGLVGDDAGLVINPDGARNQLEGGIIHAASMTLKEPVTLDGDGIASLDWNRYPIPRFS